ncbi:hypothetical protein ACK3YF_07510 [Aeromonas allosaccharophila]|uniref:hypothetical protein n=1 Tax=Aeromonas allosaccharophila TaxID=656 RepID=UPI003986C8F5
MIIETTYNQKKESKKAGNINTNKDTTSSCPLTAYLYGDVLAQLSEPLRKKFLPVFQEVQDQALKAIKKLPLLTIRRTDGSNEGINGVIPLLETATLTVWVCGDWAKGPESVIERCEIKLADYTLPNYAEMEKFCRLNNHPWRRGSNFRLWDKDYFDCQEGCIDLDSFNKSSNKRGTYIACNRRFKNDLPSMLLHLIQKNYQLQPLGSVDMKNNLLAPLCELQANLINLIKEHFLTVDSLRAPLPKLDDTHLSEKGLWELYGENPVILNKLGLRARNPELDVKDWPITIDFGTSSTVVAYNEQLQAKLFRVAVKDFFNKAEPRDYENPTILQIDDLQAVLTPWQHEAYRPAVKWGDVLCSHEARASQRKNEADSDLTASLLGKLKQWALREANDMRVKFKDNRHQFEHELRPLTERFPAKNQPLTVSPDDPFDPIELYAYFLGLTINWRQRGLFLKYYMSFPVDYPIAVKNRVRASFSRGLQRSLPEQLLQSEKFSEFEVTELASEPAAFAAAALPYFKIEPDQAGIHYGVFDFGGGTTDFDFGLYRQATEEEENNDGFEYAFEHFGACGDRFLGGENLLENLAYRVFLDNLTQCRNHHIAFTKPLDANNFEGCEMLLEETQAAITNSQMVMSKLRPFWESNEQEDGDIISVTLIDREGESQIINLTVNYEELSEYLDKRLERGVSNFFTALHTAFTQQDILPRQLHILLAGNACLSERLQDLFALEPDFAFEANETNETKPKPQRTGLNSDIKIDVESFCTCDCDCDCDSDCYCECNGKCAGNKRAEGAQRIKALLAEKLPGCELIIYPPILQNPEKPYQPTTKTGVALGLLNLTPGKGVKVVNHSAKTNLDGEAPFSFSVGRIRRRQYSALLKPHATYGQWHELGVVSQGGFVLVFSNDPNAEGMPDDSPELRSRTLRFSGNTQDHRLFARVISPTEIEYATAESLHAIDGGSFEHQSRLKLTMA